jgi:hypothetical protein
MQYKCFVYSCYIFASVFYCCGMFFPKYFQSAVGSWMQDMKIQRTDFTVFLMELSESTFICRIPFNPLNMSGGPVYYTHFYRWGNKSLEQSHYDANRTDTSMCGIPFPTPVLVSNGCLSRLKRMEDHRGEATSYQKVPGTHRALLDCLDKVMLFCPVRLNVPFFSYNLEASHQAPTILEQWIKLHPTPKRRDDSNNL